MRRTVIALALCTLGAVNASAQQGPSALRGHNSNAPVNWSADRIEVLDRADRVLLTGNVVAEQGDLTMTAPRVTVAYTSAGGVSIDRIDASGGVTVRSPSETARGAVAIYDIDSRLITLVGGVTLTRGESQVRGGRLVLNLVTGRAVMDGSGPAPGVGSTAPGGRVTGTFKVAQRTPGQQQ